MPKSRIVPEVNKPSKLDRLGKTYLLDKKVKLGYLVKHAKRF